MFLISISDRANFHKKAADKNTAAILKEIVTCPEIIISTKLGMHS